MTTSSLSSSETKKLAILAALVVFVLSFAGVIALSSSWTVVAQSEEIEAREEITTISNTGGASITDLSVSNTKSGSAQDVTETPTIIAELLPPQDTSIPTPFSLPEPSSTPKPTSTPTLVIIDTPTPPLPSPTATSQPTATDTSTSTPLPTATSLPTATLPPTPTATLQSEIKHVVIISIDGLRPDALDLADTPILDDLLTKGAYSPHAQTINPNITLPSHASMLTGMTPDKHGILWGMPYIGWPGLNGPSLMSVAHDAGLSTAMAFGKDKLNYLVLPNSVDECFGTDAHDTEVKENALEFIEAGLPNVLFVHLPDTDRVGHAYGWMSPNQLYAVNFVDGVIGEIVAALESGGYLNSTLLIITADHGGNGMGHSEDTPINRTIPWLAIGPGVPAGVTLTSNINTYDTAATALHALKLPIPENWDGQPILEIFQ